MSGGRHSLSRHAAKSLRRFGRCQDGATAIEYGLICVLMAAGILAAFPLLKEPLEALATFIGDSMGVV